MNQFSFVNNYSQSQTILVHYKCLNNGEVYKQVKAQDDKSASLTPVLTDYEYSSTTPFTFTIKSQREENYFT